MVVVLDSSVPGGGAHLRPAWRKCLTMTIRPTSTMVVIGLQETNTIGYLRYCEASTDLPCPFWRKANNFRELVAFVPPCVATIKLANTKFYLDIILYIGYYGSH